MFDFLPANRLHRHLLFWGVVVVYFFIPQWIYPDYIDTVTHYYFNFDYQHSPHFLVILFLYVLLVGIIYTYLFLRYAFPPLLAGRYAMGVGRYMLLTMGICYLARLFTGLHVAVLDPLLRGIAVRPFDMRHVEGYFFNQVYIHEYSTLILVVAFYKFFTNWLQKQQEANRLAREKISTEIQLLKTRLNPDFLLDTLDRLQTLTRQRAGQSPDMVMQLAHFLRYVLYESRAETVPLRHDLEAMRQYIALETARFGNQIDIAFEQTGLISEQTIAPLLWLPLLENAFQHSVVTAIEQAWISLSVSITADTLTLRFLNNCGPSDAPNGLPGNKLLAVRQRLDSAYPGHYELITQADEEIFLVVLNVWQQAKTKVACVSTGS